MVRASVTRLENKIAQWEDQESLADADRRSALKIPERLTELSKEFKTYHVSIVDQVETEEGLVEEQKTLDTFEDKVEELSDRVEVLVGPPVVMGPPMGLVPPESEKVDEERKATLEVLAGLSSVVKGLVEAQKEHKPSVETRPLESGVKLPKIEVPTFNGNILEWNLFWEQFEVTVHSKTHISDAEKFAYLRQAIKDGPARHVIEGLAHSASNYLNAVECLHKRYDKPRQTHKAHVKAILDVASVRDGHGKELRRLHDVLSQHLRALDAMEYSSWSHLMTSIIELKLDQETLFEWERHTQGKKKVPDPRDLLDFLDLRAQACEAATLVEKKKQPTQQVKTQAVKKVSFTATEDDGCVLCDVRHPLYACKKYRQLSHDDKVSLLMEQGLCMNCFRKGHIARKCPAASMCTKCDRPHHTVLHMEAKKPNVDRTATNNVSTHTSLTNAPSTVLLMTCQVKVVAPNGAVTKARALLDTGSSTSFISEHLVQLLRLSRKSCTSQVSGIGDVFYHASRGVTRFHISRVKEGGITIPVQATILKKITTDLPSNSVRFKQGWDHLKKIELADPEFGTPAKIDLILGADVYNSVIRHGRRSGPPGSPTAHRTALGWVLAGTVHASGLIKQTNTCCVSSLVGDEALRAFWEIEDCKFAEPALSIEERAVVRHFEATHSRDALGRFIVHLPRKDDCPELGESRTMALKRFMNLERSLKAKGQFEEFAQVMNEYFELDHAELVPRESMSKPSNDSYYMPMHAVRKSSTTTKIRIVFDASARTSTGTTLNEQFMIGPTVHSPLIDVLLRFRKFKIAMTTDVSRMYRAVLLPEEQRDLHRFFWRESSNEALQEYRMTRLTFGVSASPFAANMAVKRNAIDLEKEYPQAAEAVFESFYVDDGLVGAETKKEARELQGQLQGLFGRGGFLLRKWKASDEGVLSEVPDHLKDVNLNQEIRENERFTKVLGIEWNSELDAFHPLVYPSSSNKLLTKRNLVSEIAKIYDILGWCSPTIIKMKILLQRVWEHGTGWDEVVPSKVEIAWNRWRRELPALRDHLIPRYYFKNDDVVKSCELHGFCDASESAYAAVVYIRSVYENGEVHLSLVAAKTKVAPVKRLTIPRLELCGALILSRLLRHCATVLKVSMESVYAWVDSLVVLSWLSGNPRRFKTFVGNRVSEIMDLIPPGHWNHVQGSDNPADCASRGLYPKELKNHETWWYGPRWLREPQSQWPATQELLTNPVPCEERNEETEVSLVGVKEIALLEKISDFTRLIRIMAWIL